MYASHLRRLFFPLLGVASLFILLVPARDSLAQSIGVSTDICAKPPHRPRACVGFVPPDHWGATPETGEKFICPANYALFDLDDPPGAFPHDAQYSIRGTCCPLPASDILINQHEWKTTKCPSDHVATGVRQQADSDWQMRCTKINTTRYELESGGHDYEYWDADDTSRIPAGIRHAVGRQNKDEWDSDGCVAAMSLSDGELEIGRWGGLLVERDGKWCYKHEFKRVQFTGLPGDPEHNTHLHMFPDCVAPPDPNDPAATCEGGLPPFPCEDGKDNDGDGLTDMADPGCGCWEDDERDPDVACDNGLDDDNDGRKDTADPGCDGPTDTDENLPPENGTIQPASACSSAGREIVFTATYSDPEGWQDIKYVLVAFISTDPAAPIVTAVYTQTSNTLTLKFKDDAGAITKICPLGDGQTLDNSAASLDCAKTKILRSRDATTLTVQWVLTFTKSFAEHTYNTWLRTKDVHDAWPPATHVGTWEKCPPKPQCADDWDNDQDGLIDQQDPGCFTNIAKPNTYDETLDNEQRATTQCQDDHDNDGDGKKDEDDPGCWANPQDPATHDPTGRDEGRDATPCKNGNDRCTNPDPDTYAECEDGEDNDGDGVIDAQDPGCWADPTDAHSYDPFLSDEARGDTSARDRPAEVIGDLSPRSGCTLTPTEEATLPTALALLLLVALLYPRRRFR